MFYTLEEATYGFETAKQILGVGSNTMSKLIDLNLVAIRNTPSSVRNQQYAGWDIAYLASARNRPLLIEDGQKALVCAMGREKKHQVPSMYFDATWDAFQQDLSKIAQNVNEQTWEAICSGELRVTGYWAVKEEDANFLEENHAIAVASYAGFILDGGRIQSWVRNVFDENGRRCFVVKPFDNKERFDYAHNYLVSRKGPMNRIWTAQELKNDWLQRIQEEVGLSETLGGEHSAKIG